MERPLSERELEVAVLIADGLTNREIARKLGIAHSPVKNHVSSILTKLGFTNRVEVLAWLANKHHEPQEA